MRYDELDKMTEVLGHTIARQEAEEAFFRRSAGGSESEAARALFLEIAEDLGACRKDLEAIRRRLLDTASREG